MRGHHFSDLFAVHLGLTGDFFTVMRESGAFWKLIPSGRQCSFVERRRADQVGSVSPQCDDGERRRGDKRRAEAGAGVGEGDGERTGTGEGKGGRVRVWGATKTGARTGLDGGKVKGDGAGNGAGLRGRSRVREAGAGRKGTE